MSGLLLRVARGDITRWRADAIVTSANAGLCGNRTPSYWRFRRPREKTIAGFVPADGLPFENVDGQVHTAAGPELQEALTAIAEPRYFRMKGGGALWRGSLLPQSTDGLVAVPAGGAVRTPAFGELRKDGVSWVVHAVAPDGRYQSASSAMPVLRATFTAAFTQADDADW